jgi:hypothetical protein
MLFDFISLFEIQSIKSAGASFGEDFYVMISSWNMNKLET